MAVVYLIPKIVDYEVSNLLYSCKDETVLATNTVVEIKECQAIMDYLCKLPVKNGSKLPVVPVDKRAAEVRAIKVN